MRISQEHAIRQTLSRFFVPFAVAFSLIALSACTPSKLNTENLGTGSSEAEIRAHYANKSVRYASTYAGKVDTEAYFAADGTIQLDEMGGGNFTQPRQTPGFQNEKRFQTLKQQFGA